MMLSVAAVSEKRLPNHAPGFPLALSVLLAKSVWAKLSSFLSKQIFLFASPWASFIHLQNSKDGVLE